MAAGYMTGLLWRANADGRWVFAVFTVFFLVLSFAPFLPKGWWQKKDKEIAATRFAGAWVLPFYLLLFGGLLILAALVGFFHTHGK